VFVSGGELKQSVDESIVLPDILRAYSSDLTFSKDVDRFIALDGSPRRLKFTESLLGVHAPFYRSVVLLENVVQVLDGSMLAAASQRHILLHVGDSGAIDGSQIRVDHARL